MTLAVTSISGDLWQPTVGVSGIVSDTTAAIWVNGVQGTNHGDGTWNVANVPVSSGGVASFDTKAIPAGGGDPDATTNMVKSSGIVMESATWNTDTHDYMGPLRDEGWELEKTSGNYSSTTGGQYTDHFEVQNTNAVTYYTTDTTTKLSPQSYVTDASWQDSDGGSHDYGPGGLFPIAQEEGSFTIDSGTGMVRHWQKNSTVCMVLHTGGFAGTGNQHLFQLSAIATEMYPTSRTVPLTQISVAGQTLDTNGLVYVPFPDGAEVDCTPFTPVPYYSFTVGQSSECIRKKITFDDNPTRPASWLTNTWNWQATLSAVCPNAPGSTNYSTLSSINWGFSIDTGFHYTLNPTNTGGDNVTGQIVITSLNGTYATTPEGPGVQVSINAYYIGCCDNKLKWVQQITTDSLPVTNEPSPPCIDNNSYGKYSSYYGE